MVVLAGIAAAVVLPTPIAHAGAQSPLSQACGLLASSPVAVAVVDGVAIAARDLADTVALAEIDERHLRDEVAFVRARHRAQEDALAALIEQRVLAQEAVERNTSSLEVLTAELQKHGRPVTAEQVELFYRANAARLNRSDPQTEQEVREYLEARNRDYAHRQALADIERRHGVRTFLEPVRLPVTGGCSPPRGSRHPSVTIVEFGEFECPYCAALEPLLQRLLREFPDDVQLYFRNSPVNAAHTHARAAAEASLCAAEQGKFWPLHDALFRAPGKLSEQDIRAVVRVVHLAVASFDSCMSTHRYAAIIEHDSREGAILGVQGTPTLFVNGVLYAGTRSYAELRQIVESERSRGAVVAAAH
jgi:predicted DsbA family dithiol-disulfide isomerase